MTTTETKTAIYTEIMKVANWRIEDANQVLEKFKARLDEDPAYAFEWSMDAFFEAAQKTVWKQVLVYIGDNPNLETDPQIIVDELTKQALQEARFPSRSTSPVSNEMAREMASARCKIAERVESIIRVVSGREERAGR